MFDRFFKKKAKPVPVEVEPVPEEKKKPAPEDESALTRLRESVGWVPEELLAVYRNPEKRAADSFARLMPIDEMLDNNATLAAVGFVQIGPVNWFWTDDNSNYCGIYADGPLKGWLTRLNHDEPWLTPAYRSVTSFLSYLSNPKDACSIPDLVTEIPTTKQDPVYAESDQRLANHFRELYLQEQDDDKKRLFAFSSICLTPVENTGNVLSFLNYDDIWIPEAAVRLLELRGYDGGIAEVEKLAREGQANGDSTAIRHLIRLDTGSAKEAVSRLNQTLTGQKRQILEIWGRGRLLPPRWP